MSEVEIVLKTEVPTNGKGSGMNPKIVLVDHPLVRSKLSMLRDKRTSSKDYRDLIYQIGLFVGLRATANLKLNGEENINGVIQPYLHHTLSEKIAFVPIMRGGIGLTDAMLTLIPDAPVRHLGIFKEKASNQPIEYYNKLPSQNEYDICYILDPVIATGGTILAAIDMIKELGVKEIGVVSICCSEEGLGLIAERHPDVHVYCAAIDPVLDPSGVIIPGIGDAGDRIFSN